jgi:DNA adenine methylase
MSKAATIGALAPWFGAKRTLASRIVEQLGPHRCYLEPFCGSMAVLLAKEQATMETVNDLHGDLVNLARTVQGPRTWAAFYRRLRRTMVSQSLWRDSADIILSQPFEATPERAYHYFVFCWLGRNGSAGSNGGQNFCVRYTSKGGSPGTRFRSAVDSIPAWMDRLRGVIILSMDAFELIDRFEDSQGTVIYADPPYLVKGAKYTHDFAAADHVRLAAALSRFRHTRVVVSYYAHPDLESLYPGWTVLDVATTKFMVQAGRRDEQGVTKAPEVLLINGPAMGEKGPTMFAEVV